MSKRKYSIRKCELLFVLFLLIGKCFAQAPSISSFAPRSGILGTNVTITGTNFGPTTALNIVYFGAVRAVIVSASPTSLSVLAPLGATYEPISVTVNGYTAYSASPFVVTKAIGQTLSSTSFATHLDFPVTGSPRFLTLSDYDYNGIADIALPTNASVNNNLAVFRNKADCQNLSFNAEQDLFSNDLQPKGGVASADFDGDGIIDLALSEPSKKLVVIWQNLSNTGSISFNNGTLLTAAGLTTGDIKIADMDADGKPDIVVALFNSLAPASGVAIYRNTSTGPGSFSFSAPQTVTFLFNPSKIALSDIDGDGKPDIIVSDGISTVRVRRNNSLAGTLDNTSFDAEVPFTTAGTPGEIRVGDLDGDGKTDLAISCANAISLLRNTATSGAITASSFAAKADVTGIVPVSIALADLNGDAKADLVVSNGSNVSVYQNQATSGSLTASSFGAKTDFSIGTATAGEIEIGDMNSDGYLDLATAQNGNFFSVFLYNPPTNPAPVITSFSPASAVAASSVTINGSNFAPSLSSNSVYFGATKGTITSATAVQLVVTVPAYATYGPITVENLTYHLSGISRSSFTPVFDNNKDFGGRIIPSSMGAAVALPIGSSTAATVSLGDIDGDGFTDLLVSTTSNDSLTILRNKGNKILGAAGFERTGLYFLTAGNNFVLSNDVDSDGKLDLVMLVRGPADQDEILIYHNESTPGSLTPASFGPVYQVHLPFLHINNGNLAVADMDGDGKPDLICQNSGVISVFKNNSTIGSFCFAPSVDINNSGGFGISVGDVDGDGKLDIAAGGGQYGYVGFHLIQNTSSPGILSFGAPVVFAPSGIGAYNFFEIADLDSDGKPDISWFGYNASGNALQVMHNVSTPGTIDASSLAPMISYPWNFPAYSGYAYSKVADINGDGKPDVVVGNYSVGIFQNAGKAGVIDASSFLNGVAFQIPANYSADYPAIGDLDGDGKPEVITTDGSYVSNVVSIFHNECYPAPRIDVLKNSSTTTQTGPVGSTVITQGDYQFTNNDSPTVRFGAAAGHVNSASNASVNTNVPSGATDERVAVTLHGLTGFSTLPFNSTFATNGTLDATTFPASIDLSLVTGATPALVVSDFDNDGNPDFVAGDGGQILIMRSSLASAGADLTASMFAPILPEFGGGIGAEPIVVGDFDGDGLVDLTANSTGWRNNSGTQPLPISFESGIQIMPGAIQNTGRLKTNIDFNHDGKTDAISAQSSGFVYVSENLSRKGAFSSTTSFSTFGNAVALSVSGNLGESSAADFDGDGFDDVVYLVKSTNQLQASLNAGLNREISSASFGAAQPFTTDASPTYIFVTDFNQDGKPDVAVAYSALATVSIFQNTSTAGSISFSKLDFTSLANATGLSAADLDGDGKQEIVTVHGNGNTPFNFSILKNTSATATVSFGPKLDFALPNQPEGLALADMNLDGKTDLLISHGTVVSVFQNKLASTNIILVGTQPSSSSVCAGTTASFITAASGTTNITYQWQFSTSQTGTYADISNGNGYSNVTTSDLSVNTTGNFGAGFYECRINGDLATQVITTPAQLVLQTDCSGAGPVITAQTLSTGPGGRIVIDLIPLIKSSGSIDVSSIVVEVPPASGAVATIDNGVLTIDYAQEPKFTGAESITIKACDQNGICSDQLFPIDVANDIVVWHGFSPNGDQFNPHFEIQNIELLPTTQNNQVTIYNRWGDEVFSVTNYDNATRAFVGVSNSGNKLPAGIYFYKIVLPDAKKTLQGYVSLKD